MSLIIGLWSVGLITSIRTIINNLFTPKAVSFHVYSAIALILIILVFFALLDKAKSNITGLIWMALVLLSTLAFSLQSESFTDNETWLANHPMFSFIADYVVKGLGGKAVGTVIEPTNGKWISGIYGAGIGAFFGCRFSRLAIAGDEGFDWLWRTYVRFTSIGGTTFNKANLTGASFDSATLQGASFNHAIIDKTSWDDAKCLDCAFVKNSYLK
jgi:hypothetical protein